MGTTMDRSTASETVAVVGAGTMGAGIAGVFAARGYRVTLYSRSEATLAGARSAIGAIAGRDEAVSYTTSLEACLADADVVSENVAELLEAKRSLFDEIERGVGAHCLLTTNTSSLPIGAIGARMRHPHRLVGLHWFNPPAIMPLVEIVRGPRTSDETLTRVRALCAALGRDVIDVARDVPGFVVNRLQYALLREALHLVEEGIASVADVDRAVETTLAPRWSSAGPLRLMDLAGLDTVEKVSAVIMPALSRGEAVPPLVARLVSAGALGAKTGRGFYDWTAETVATAVRERDAAVRLLTEGRER